MKSKLLRTVFLASVVGCTAWLARSTEGSGQPYLMTFDDLSYSNKIPDGWVYQPDDRTDYYSYTLSISSNYGIDNSKAMSFDTQVLEEIDDYWDDWSVRSPRKVQSDDLSDCRYALMITTPVAGEVCFYARTKNSTDKEFIRIYDVTESNGKYTPVKESPLAYTESTETFTSNSRDTEWTKISLNVGETPKRIALHISNKYVDNFSAERAFVPEIYKLNLYSFGVNGSSKNLYCDSEGNITIPVKFKLENKGNVTLTPGMEKYSVTFLNGTNEIYTWNVDEELAPKAEKEFTVDIPYQLADVHVDEKSFSVKARENITNVTSYGETFQLYAYNAICEIYDGTADSSVSSIDLGLYSVSKDVQLRFFNKGSAPLEISALIMDENVSCSLDLPVTLQAGEKLPFTLTFTGSEGSISGDVMIASNGTGADNKTLIHYKGSVVEEGTYLATFDDYSIPEGWILTNEDSWRNYTQSNNKVLYSTSSESSVGKIITKKIAFTEGDTFNITFAGSSFYGTPSPWLKIYYSTDRTNWVLAQEFVGASDGGDYEYPSPAYKSESIAIPEGEYYIALEAYKTYVDHVYGGTEASVIHDLYVTDFIAPSAGMVNYPVVASVKVKNMTGDTEEASNYSVSLLLGDEVVETAESVELATGVDASTFNFSFIPHVAFENLPLKVRFAFNDESGYSVSSEEKIITVEPERMISEVQVGEITTGSYGYSSTAPLSSMYKNSLCLTNYSADLIPVAAGERITKLTYFYDYSNSVPLVRNMKIWIANGSEKTEWNDSTTMQLIFDQSFEFKTTPKEIAEKYTTFDIEIPDGFIYEGNGIQVMSRSESEDYKSTHWACFSSGDNVSKYVRNDTYAGYKDKSTSTVKELPVIKLALDKKAVTLSGTVNSRIDDSEDTEAVLLSGAVVRMEGDGLLYEAITDEEGKFELPIYQSSHEFTGKIMASGHRDGFIEAATYAEDSDIQHVLAENVVDRNEVGTQKNPNDENNVTLTWEHVVPGSLDVDKDVSYSVYVNGTKVGDTFDNVYTIEDISQYAAPARSESSYEIGLTAKYGDHETSPVYVSFKTTALEGLFGAEVQVRVVGHDIIIKGNGAAYEIFDIEGKIISEGMSSSENVAVSVNPGVYAVKISDCKTSLVSKVIVK